MKKLFFATIILLLLIGCDNKEEKTKNKYLAMKSELLEKKEFINKEELPCDITVKIDRINKEKISYSILLSNAKENMNNIKAIAVHNYYTENLYPTIGIFNKKENLTKDKTEKTIKLKGEIESTEDIDKLNLYLKILIKYQTDDNNKKDIYYKTT